MPATFLDLPIATIEKALDLRKQIEALKSSVNEILGGHEPRDGGEVAKRRGRPLKAASVDPGTMPVPYSLKKDGRKGKRSAAARAKMAAAQKARWAKKRGESAPAVKGAKKKRTMSPEARAKIAAAQRARWAQRNQPF